MAARRSLPVTKGCCGHGSQTPAFSGTRTDECRSNRGSRRSTIESSTRSSAASATRSRAWRRWPIFWRDHVSGADVARSRRAVRLAKADLSTGMVGEFPELQGIMGRYYALHDGEHPAVADAIADHYKPLGPSDACPTAPESIVVALADKIDSLVGVLRDRRKADRVERPVRATPGGAGNHSTSSREPIATAARCRHSARQIGLGPGVLWTRPARSSTLSPTG